MNDRTIATMEVEPPLNTSAPDVPTSMRIGKITVSAELLLSLFGLDGDHVLAYITPAERDTYGAMTVDMIVSGPLMPLVRIGDFAPSVSVVIRKKEAVEVETTGA